MNEAELFCKKSKWNILCEEHCFTIYLVESTAVLALPVTTEPVVISKSLHVRTDLSWRLFIHGKLANHVPVLSSIDEKITYKSIHLLLDISSSHSVCTGQPDDSFVSLVHEKKGAVFSLDSTSDVAYLHEGYPVTKDTSTACIATVRHHKCELLVSEGEQNPCLHCAQYRSNLCSILSKQKRKRDRSFSTPRSKRVNVRYMNTPQLVASHAVLRRSLVCYRKKMKRLTAKIEEITKTTSIDIDDDLHSDIQRVVESDLEKLYNHDDFSRAFWKQQV